MAKSNETKADLESKVKELEKALKQAQDDGQEKAAALTRDLNEALEQVKQLEAANKDLVKKAQAAVQEPEEPQPVNVEPEHLDAACEAYGIDPEFVFAAGYSDDGGVVIVTHGGARVVWFEGDKAEPLDQVAVTGVSAKKSRHVAGAK